MSRSSLSLSRSTALKILTVAAIAVLLSTGAAGAREFTATRQLSARSSAGALDGPLGFGGSPLGFGFGSALRGSAPTQPGPSAVAVDPATHTIYVANGNNAAGPNAGGDTISVIDARRCNAQDVSRCHGPWPTITVGNLPSTIAVDVATDTVYVTNIGDGVDDSTVSVFNGATCDASAHWGCGQTPASVPVGVTPVGIFADQANHTVYVGNLGNGTGDTVSMIDSATCTGTDLAACPTTEPPTVTVGDAPDDIDVNQATHTVYAAVSGGVSAFDANTCNAIVQTGCGTVGSLAGDADGVFSAKVDPVNDTLYTANDDGTVSVFDLQICQAGALANCASDTPGTVTTPVAFYIDGSLWVAVDPANHSVYVAYYHSDTLRVINTDLCGGSNLAGCATLDPPEIHTGTEPESVALDPTSQTLYTANEVDNDVSVINASRCDAQTTTGCRHLPPEVPTASPGVGLAVPAVDTVYVMSGADTVAMIDTTTCNAFHTAGCSQTPPTATVGTAPFAAAVDGRTHTVYVANGGTGNDGTVSVFDDRTCNATNQTGCGDMSTVDVPAGEPAAIAVNPVTNTVYVVTDASSGPQHVYVYSGVTCHAGNTAGCGQTPASVDIGVFYPVGVDVDEATNTIYAASTEGTDDVDGYVSAIDGDTCDAADTTGCTNTPATVTVGVNPEQIGVEQATNTVYVENQEDGDYAGTVSVINGATCNGRHEQGCGTPVAVAPVGFGPFNLSIDQSSDQIYVDNTQDTSVSVLDGARCNGTHTGGCDLPSPRISVVDYPTSIAIDSAVGTGYVGSPLGGDSVIPLAHRTSAAGLGRPQPMRRHHGARRNGG